MLFKRGDEWLLWRWGSHAAVRTPCVDGGDQLLVEHNGAAFLTHFGYPGYTYTLFMLPLPADPDVAATMPPELPYKTAPLVSACHSVPRSVGRGREASLWIKRLLAVGVAL